MSAQNVSVEVLPSEAVRLTAVHNDYPFSDTGVARRFELGDLYAREPKPLLLEFFVPALAESPDVEVARVTVVADVLTDAGGMEHQTVRFTVHSPLSREGQSDPEVRRELILMGTAKARRDALEQERRGNVAEASGVLREAVSRIRESPLAHDPTLREQAEDLSGMADQLDQHGHFGVADAKYMGQRAYNAGRGKAMYEDKLSRVRRKS